MTNANFFCLHAKKARQDKNLTLRQVAEQANVHYTTISKIESNQFKPSEELVKKLAEIYEQDFYSFCRKAGIIPSEIIDLLLNDDTIYNLAASNARYTEEFRKFIERAKRQAQE